MRIFSLLMTGIFACGLLGCSTASTTPAPAPSGTAGFNQESLPKDEPVFKAPDKKEAPTKERAKIEIPDAILKEACEKVKLDRKTLGFTDEEIERYSGSDFRLKQITKLFKDATKLPRYSGRLTDILLSDPKNFAANVTLGYSLLSSYTGGGVTPPKEGWGVEWIPEDWNMETMEWKGGTWRE